jgi:hypothetical protein
MNKWDMMRDAIHEAKETIRAADSCVEDMILIIADKLERPFYRSRKTLSALAKMKRELRNFDARTWRWKK